MKFSHKEKKDLFFAGIMISFAFAVLLSGGFNLKINSDFLIAFVIAFFTAGIGFLLHELMHKYFAIKYGLFGEFKAFYGMLWIAILFSFFGFILAAPGAVFIKGKITKSKNGKISLAGPATNLILALIFLALIFFLGSEGIFKMFLKFGFTINSLLATFNLIPAGLFDGKKVYAWSKKVYYPVLIISIILFILSFLI